MPVSRAKRKKGRIIRAARTGTATPAKKRAYLEAVRQHFNVEQAALAIGTTRRRVFEWRKADPEFEAACQEAREAALDRLEDKAYEVALNEKGEYYEKDALLNRMFLLKGHRPHYKDAWRPEADAPPVVITFNLPEREGMKTVPQLEEHVIEAEYSERP